MPMQGGPEKMERHTSQFPQYADAITILSAYGLTSPEKNDTKITNVGSVVCFLGHIL